MQWILSTVNPPLSPPGGLFILSSFEVGINRDGSVLHKEVEYIVEKLKYKKF